MTRCTSAIARKIRTSGCRRRHFQQPTRRVGPSFQPSAAQHLLGAGGERIMRLRRIQLRKRLGNPSKETVLRDRKKRKSIRYKWQRFVRHRMNFRFRPLTFRAARALMLRKRLHGRGGRFLTRRIVFAILKGRSANRSFFGHARKTKRAGSTQLGAGRNAEPAVPRREALRGPSAAPRPALPALPAADVLDENKIL